MHLKSLNIRDFGILHNQNLTDLNSGLVVIGGLNRAGKTTTLQLLRYLGYGLPRDNSIPEPRNEYDLQADYRWKGQEYNLSLQGYGEPQINNLSGGSKQNVYQELDSYTYQQLFTISLEELYQLPDKAQEQKRLQSILLGAGLSDILQMQQLKEDFKNKAEDIGGKNGTRNVYQFKEPQQKIKEGLNLRQEAREQLDEYQEFEKELIQLKKEIKTQETKVDNLQADVTILDLLKNNYQDFAQRKKLEVQLSEYDYQDEETKYSESTLQEAQSLKEKFLNLKDEIAAQKQKLRKKTGLSSIAKVQKSLEEQQEQITEINYKLSGLEERLNNYQNLKQRIKKTKQELLRNLKEENEAWTNLTVIEKIKIDKEINDQLHQIINNWQETKRNYNQQQEKIAELKAKQNRIKTELSALTEINFTSRMRNYYLIAAGFTGLGLMGSFVFEFWLGIIIALVGIIGAAINYSSSYLFNNKQLSQHQRLKSELQAIKKQQKQAEQKLESITETKEKLDSKVDNYRKQLKLSSSASGNLIKDRFSAVKDFKRRIRNLRQEEKNREQLKDRIIEELTAMKDLMQNFAQTKLINVSQLNGEELITKSNQLIANFQQLNEYLNLADDLSALQLKHQEIIAQSSELLNLDLNSKQCLAELNKFIKHCNNYFEFKTLQNKLKTLQAQLDSILSSDLVQAAVSSTSLLANPNNTNHLFTKLFASYSSWEEVEAEYQRKQEKLTTAQERLTSLQEQRTTIKNNKEDLASSNKLQQAQKKIKQGRQNLRPLAEEFAVHRAAATILDKVQQRFINKVQAEMLAPASEILAELTQGEYQQIVPHNDLSTVDFKLKSETDRNIDTIANLSRGTQEQLFLAVRISRIKEIEPNLPVILDDSLVNFDLFHQQQVVAQLTELAEEQQVFILTCHPQLVELLQHQSEQAQYWKLDRGQFDKLTANKLVKHLSNSMV